MRGYQESLEVAAGVDAAPVGFVWRGRRYRVVQVLDTWREHLPWWRLAVLPRPADDPTDSPDAADPGALGECAPERRVPLRYQSEQRVWRVEAAAGRLGTTGVFELAHRDDAWCLRRLSD